MILFCALCWQLVCNRPNLNKFKSQTSYKEANNDYSYL
ncbi:hypothetical protein CPL00229_CDS0058 [Escherichia phage vB_Eco_mar004NP2]|uniref:Uncharacterized protein n=1 Tax=Salmonella phage PMBT29 TaxID=3137286 RepID=A0AAU8BU25_9VIRU